MAKWLCVAVLFVASASSYAQYEKPERFHATVSTEIICDGDVAISLSCNGTIKLRDGSAGQMEINYNYDDHHRLVGHISIKARDGSSDIEWGAPVDKVVAINGTMIVVFSAFDHKGKAFSGMATLKYKTIGARTSISAGGVVHLGVL